MMHRSSLATQSFILLSATVAVGLASTARTNADATEEWDMCSKICRAAAGKRMAFAGGRHAVECWGSSRGEGVLRVLDWTGVELLAYQACSYGAAKASQPLWITRRSTNTYDIQFRASRHDASRSSFEVRLVPGA
mmetsp:Transcript_118410/g.335757  ORF Transcript_118410/g.335757 Transcript_118410/m.335757 type:complete len:135 (+) Transcript_118410:76-480(+)